jgi:hypothetical protein
MLIIVNQLLPNESLSAYYPLANEVAMGYSNATFRNILVTTLESTSFNGF